FLELIIDPACSIVFESEQVDPKIMEQPPRTVGKPMFDGRGLMIAGLQGVSVFVAVLGVYLWSIFSDRPDDAVRSITFATLVVSNLALILVNRSWRLSMWQTFRQRKNPTLKWILAAAGTMLIVLLTVRGLRNAFNFGSMRPEDWVVA